MMPSNGRVSAAAARAVFGNRLAAVGCKRWLGCSAFLSHKIDSHDQNDRQVVQPYQVFRDDDRFELSAPVPLSLICFRRKGTDEANRELLGRVNASGEVLLSSTVLHGRFVLRLAIGNHSTTREHVLRAWEIIKAQA